MRCWRRDADTFLHQAMSTPCLNVLRGASGAWIEDEEARLYLDFHGNDTNSASAIRGLLRRSKRNWTHCPFARGGLQICRPSAWRKSWSPRRRGI